MIIYIAGRFEDRGRIRPWRERLRDYGYTVGSSWLNHPDEVVPLPANHALWKREATRDLQEIRDAHILIVDTLSETPRGGREVEFGYGYALDMDIYLVGPPRNVFHALATRQFDTWEACIEFFRDFWGTNRVGKVGFSQTV